MIHATIPLNKSWYTSHDISCHDILNFLSKNAQEMPWDIKMHISILPTAYIVAGKWLLELVPWTSMAVSNFFYIIWGWLILHIIHLFVTLPNHIPYAIKAYFTDVHIKLRYQFNKKQRKVSHRFVKTLNKQLGCLCNVSVIISSMITYSLPLLAPSYQRLSFQPQLWNMFNICICLFSPIHVEHLGTQSWSSYTLCFTHIYESHIT